MMPVLGVLSDRYRSQILAPVVEAIAVDMVHLKAVGFDYEPVHLH
jgi:hypothetical protein